MTKPDIASANKFHIEFYNILRRFSTDGKYLDEANVNGEGAPGFEIDIADLVYMVDFMFTGGPEPATCP